MGRSSAGMRFVDRCRRRQVRLEHKVLLAQILP